MSKKPSCDIISSFWNITTIVTCIGIVFVALITVAIANYTRIENDTCTAKGGIIITDYYGSLLCIKKEVML